MLEIRRTYKFRAYSVIRSWLNENKKHYDDRIVMQDNLSFVRAIHLEVHTGDLIYGYIID